jgi:hypothetical protein
VTAPAAPTYAVEPADAERDRETVLAIWRGNLGREARMAEKYDWFYRRCPLGSPLTLLLRHLPSGEAVGVATAGPRRMRIGQREVSAGVLVDLAVLPEHRTLGPALVLQQGLMDAAATRFELLYGLPNRKAIPVFKRVGYGALGEMVRHARVLRHRDYLARRLPAALAALAAVPVDLGVRLRDAWRRRGDPLSRAQWCDAPPAELAGAGFDGLLSGVHDCAFERWRFTDGPTPPTRWLALRGADGTLQAWFATQSIDGVLHVVDAGGVPDLAGLTRAAVDRLVREARTAGHASVSVQLAGPPSVVGPWAGAGFVPRASRMLYGRWFGDGAAPPLALTAADEDE